ncbi:MAG: hypothetical protein NVSMB25_00870 [Thermoleophilaceae bacterium]
MAAVIRVQCRARWPSLAITVALSLGLAACGRPHASTDVAAFTRQGSTPQAQAILRSIGVYRTSRDIRQACALATVHFIKARFDGHEEECEYFSRQAPRTLPRSAVVEGIAGSRARVRIRELSSTRSIYLMSLEGGRWKIDDIVGQPRSR